MDPWATVVLTHVSGVVFDLMTGLHAFYVPVVLFSFSTKTSIVMHITFKYLNAPCAVATCLRLFFFIQQTAVFKAHCGVTEAHRVVIHKSLLRRDNDVSTALKWFQNNLAVSSAKQKKPPEFHRTAGEVLVCASISLSRQLGSCERHEPGFKLFDGTSADPNADADLRPVKQAHEGNRGQGTPVATEKGDHLGHSYSQIGEVRLFTFYVGRRSPHTRNCAGGTTCVRREAGI